MPVYYTTEIMDPSAHGFTVVQKYKSKVQILIDPHDLYVGSAPNPRTIMVIICSKRLQYRNYGSFGANLGSDTKTWVQGMDLHGSIFL